MNKHVALLMSVVSGFIPDSFAEAITAADVGCFYVTPIYINQTGNAVPSSNNNVPVLLPLNQIAQDFSITKGTVNPITVKFVLNLQEGVYEIDSSSNNYNYGYYADFFNAMISDHAIAGKSVEGIPFYTWNILGFEAVNGFTTSKMQEPHYVSMRLTPMIEILKNIFQNQPNAIIALQEFTQAGHGFRNTLLKELKQLGVTGEYLTNTKGQAFGQITLYNPAFYSISKGNGSNNTSKGVSSVFMSQEAATLQSGRAFKVLFKEKAGKQRQLSVVNVHLQMYSRQLPDRKRVFKYALSEIINDSKLNGNNAVTVVLGDFNYDMKDYQNSSVKVNPVGVSIVHNHVNLETVDGIIVVQP